MRWRLNKNFWRHPIDDQVKIEIKEGIRGREPW